MNRKGDLSLKTAPIVAINFDAIFSRKSTLREKLTMNKLDRTFVKEYRELTYNLYHKGFNVYIVSLNKVKDLGEELWGKYLFFNNIVEYSSFEDLVYDCKKIYAYYIDLNSRKLLIENSYTLEEFKEIL